MASFENAILGNVKEKVGEVIGRRRREKFFIYAAPREVKISNSPEAIKSRDIMIPLAKFASIVNSIPELKYFWINSKIEDFDAFHKIEKVNYPLLIPERPTVNNTITPLEFPIPLEISGEISSDGIQIKTVIDELTLKEFDGVKELTGIGVICFFNPRSEEGEYFQLSKIKTCQIGVVVDEQIKINIPFDVRLQDKYNSYFNSLLYFTIISKDNFCTPIKYSCNYREEFIHGNIGEKQKFSIRDSQP